MTYTKILVTSEGLFATSEDGKERVKFRDEDSAHIRDAIHGADFDKRTKDFMSLLKPKTTTIIFWPGDTFDIPEGFQVTVERKKESCGHPCEKYQDICQYHGCDNVNSYAILTPLPKGETPGFPDGYQSHPRIMPPPASVPKWRTKEPENSAHGYTEGAEVPEQKELKTAEELTPQIPSGFEIKLLPSSAIQEGTGILLLHPKDYERHANHFINDERTHGILPISIEERDRGGD